MGDVFGNIGNVDKVNEIVVLVNNRRYVTLFKIS